jgi:hypothetical protein
MLNTVLSVLSGLVAVGIVPLTVAVAARWVAFTLDPSLRAAWFLAPALAPTDLVFLGVRVLASPPVVILAVMLLVSVSGFAPHRARDRANRRFDEAAQELKERTAAMADITKEMARALLTPGVPSSRFEGLVEEANRHRAAGETAQEELEDAMREIRRNPLPSDDGVYAVRRFGLAFRSRRTFIAFVAAMLLLLASTFTTNFPSGSIAVLALYGAVFMLLRSAMSAHALRLVTLAPSVVLVIVGATVAGGLDYRLPVGDFEWAESAGLPAGRYALVASANASTFVVRCNEHSAGVVAVPTTMLVSVTFVAPSGPPPGVPLYRFIADRQTPLNIGPLEDC